MYFISQIRRGLSMHSSFFLPSSTFLRFGFCLFTTISSILDLGFVSSFALLNPEMILAESVGSKLLEALYLYRCLYFSLPLQSLFKRL